MTKKSKAARKPAKAKPAAKSAAKPNGKKFPTELAEQLASAPATAIENAAVKVQLIAFDKIEESKLNPRKTRDPQKVADLAESIAQKGMQQPLKVRPHPKKAGRFEIIFGGSRRAAVELLVKAGRADAHYKVPAIVEKVSDAELIKLALIENIQRSDMSPLDEGEGFVSLREAGGSTEAVAREVGKSQKWVQMRISLVERLAPKAREALRAGEITLFQAQALYKGEPNRQVEILARVKKGWISSAENIIHELTAENPAVTAANFSLADYQSAGGELIEDEDGNAGGPWFKDVALFEKLQRESVERTEAKLNEKWAWVKVMSHGAGEHFRSWEFNSSKDPKKAGAVIEIRDDWKVAVHTGLVAKAEAKSPAGKSAHKKAAAKKNGGAQPPQVTQPLMVYAKRAKTCALQEAIALRGRNGEIMAPLVALLCITLMGEHEVTRIGPREIRGDDAVLSPLLRDALEGYRPRLGGVLRAAPRGKDIADGSGILQLKEGCAAEAFNLLLGMNTGDTVPLLALLVASRSGTFNNYSPELGDDPLAIAVAEALGVDMAEAWGKEPANWSAYLALLKKSRAVRLVAHMPGLELMPEACETMKTGELVANIGDMLEKHPEQRCQVPPELTFGAGREILAAINKAPPKRQAELGLDAGGKAEKTVKGGKGEPAAKAKGKGGKAGERKPAAAGEGAAA
jgi:ParB/RepB/Spo0J family partition protein